jgi:hypothetical protein
MTCEHLRQLEDAMIAAGIRETYRGQPWSNNCREWVYFDCFMDVDAVRHRFTFAACVKEHAHRGTHDGRERGLECTECHDAVMGAYEPNDGVPVFRG